MYQYLPGIKPLKCSISKSTSLVLYKDLKNVLKSTVQVPQHKHGNVSPAAQIFTMTAKYCLRHLKTTRWQSSDTFIKIPKNQKMSEKFGSSRHFQHPPPRNLPRDPPALVAPGRRSTAGAVPGSGPRRLLAAPGPRRPGRPSPSAARRRPNWRPPWCFLCGQKDKER